MIGLLVDPQSVCPPTTAHISTDAFSTIARGSDCASPGCLSAGFATICLVSRTRHVTMPCVNITPTSTSSPQTQTYFGQLGRLGEVVVGHALRDLLSLLNLRDLRDLSCPARPKLLPCATR